MQLMQHDGFPPSSVVSAVPLWRFIPSQLMGHGFPSAHFFCLRKSRAAPGLFDRLPIPRRWLWSYNRNRSSIEFFETGAICEPRRGDADVRVVDEAKQGTLL